MWCVSIDSTSLRSLRKFNPIIVASHHIFTPVGQLLRYMWDEVLHSGIRVGCTLFGSYLIPQSGIKAWFTP